VTTPTTLCRTWSSAPSRTSLLARRSGDADDAKGGRALAQFAGKRRGYHCLVHPTDVQREAGEGNRERNAGSVLHGGQDPAMVLLHADGENRLDWRWVLNGLASQYEVFAPDLPGFDGTGYSRDCSPGFLPHSCATFMDALRLDRAILVPAIHWAV
jgi:pimeloyl-ACP methyl ester carboxylesterase